MGDPNCFHYTSELFLPRPRSELFDFFAHPRNLETITPPWLRFHVTTPEPIAMRPGTLIDYRLRIHGIPLRWQSEITTWEPPLRFIDEQRKGPYRTWVHEHRFQETPGGTTIHDHVRYSVLGGRLINSLFVRRDVQKIFHFREAKLKQLFAP